MLAQKFDTEKVRRINHVPEILKRRRMSVADFVHEVAAATRLSRPTLYNAANGEEISYETAEKIAWFFGLVPADVLESKFD
jgi:plasmid maintenance system antidote protein VapI